MPTGLNAVIVTPATVLPAVSVTMMVWVSLSAVRANGAVWTGTGGRKGTGMTCRAWPVA